MGKRKGKKVVVQKRIYKIPKLFKCPYCLKEDGIKISLNKKKDSQVAILVCTKCGVGAQDIPVGPLTEPIDIYTDWMDQAREANLKYNASSKAASRLDDEGIDDLLRQANRQSRHRGYDDDEEIEYDRGALLRDVHKNDYSDDEVSRGRPRARDVSSGSDLSDSD